MLYTVTSKINIYDVKTENLQTDFEFKTNLNSALSELEKNVE